MTFKYRALTLGCFAAMGLVGNAHAVKLAGDLLEVYGNLYPQYQTVTFGDSSATGSAVSTLTAGKTGAQTNTFKAGAVSANKFTPVNSYIGFKGQKTVGELTLGYDVQGVVNIDSSNGSSFLSEPRDAFVFIEHKSFGSLTAGQQDTYYKQNGDKVRMLGVSSSNFVSSANVASNPTWSNKGISTSFNTRINGQLLWASPRLNGFEVGYSLRQDPSKTATRNAALSSAGINWTDNTYYVGLAQEVHDDYYSVSGAASTATAGSIYNAPAGLRSKDTATRLSFGYRAKGVRVGADTSTLKYTETSAQANGFQSYKTTTYQVTGEYDLNSQITLAAQYANNAAGNCTLNGTISCSTAGLGGNLVGFGAKYNLDRNFAIFALAAKGTANSGASISLGSGAGRTAIGGTINAAAVGIQARF
jgi:predicted porin